MPGKIEFSLGNSDRKEGGLPFLKAKCPLEVGLMRILLAEDDINIATITQLCLEKIGGHEVVLRHDGESAFDTALREPYDLIILDGMMPKKNGLQVAIELQASGVVGTPIIFLSAKTDEKDIEEFLKIGAGYISKPFDPQTICERIDEILAEDRRRTGR